MGVMEWRDIGDGCSIAFYYSQEGEPVDGVLWRHDCPNDPRGPEHGGDAIPFGPPDGQHWQVRRWAPLTLDGSLLCRACGKHGWIRDGAWVAA